MTSREYVKAAIEHREADYVPHFILFCGDVWDAVREETVVKMKSMGIIPENTNLAPKPEDIKDWNKRLSSKINSIYAWFINKL